MQGGLDSFDEEVLLSTSVRRQGRFEKTLMHIKTLHVSSVLSNHSNSRKREEVGMSAEPIININLNIDPKALSADEVGEYAAAVYAKLTAELATSGTVVAVGSPAHVVGIDKQLGRLADFKPVFAPRVKALHNELVALGYQPRLPKSEKDALPSYISYVDPVSGDNLGNLNSERFTFMRGVLLEKLKGKPHMESNSRHASCRLVSEDAVKAVVKVAKSELTTAP
jgi:hypothetical protein